MHRFISYPLLLIVVLLSCQQKGDVATTEVKQIVAQVANTKLFESELNTVIHPSINKADSAALANAYIDQWVRDQLLMKEASRFSSSDPDLEKLVTDYRQKLIRFNHENKVISERFDTLVTNEQMARFYEERKEQFVLREPLYYIDLLRLPSGVKDLNKLYAQWKKEELKDIKQILVKDSLDQALIEKRWYTWAQIEQYTSKFKKSRANGPSDHRIKDGDYECFLKVREFRDQKEISPLPFIFEQLKQMILHQRKLELIESYKNELYEKAIENDLIKIGIQ